MVSSIISSDSCCSVCFSYQRKHARQSAGDFSNFSEARRQQRCQKEVRGHSNEYENNTSGVVHTFFGARERCTSAAFWERHQLRYLARTPSKSPWARRLATAYVGENKSRGLSAWMFSGKTVCVWVCVPVHECVSCAHLPVHLCVMWVGG